MVERLMDGFKIDGEVCFIKNIKKAIDKEFEKTPDNPMAQMFTMMNPAFGLSSNLKSELEFDSIDDLQEHPMARELLKSLDSVSKMFTEKHKTAEEIKKFREKPYWEGSNFDQAKFDAFLESDEGARHKAMLE